MTQEPAPVHLAEYQPFPFHLRHVDLDFALDPTLTRVQSRLFLTRREPGADLRLDGEGLGFMACLLNGTPIRVEPDATGLTIPAALIPDSA